MSHESLDVRKFCLVHTQADRWLRLQVNQALENTGLTMMEWLLLMGVSEHKSKGLTITGVAELLGVSLPQVTALTQQLRRKKLLEQHVEPGDRRSRRLRVSSAGLAACQTGQRQIEEFIENVNKAPQLRTYNTLLTRLVGQQSDVVE